jgi:arylsulfatase A
MVRDDSIEGYDNKSPTINDNDNHIASVITFLPPAFKLLQDRSDNQIVKERMRGFLAVAAAVTLLTTSNCTTFATPNTSASDANVGNHYEEAQSRTTRIPFPNFVILFADNLGYDDVSIFRSRSSSRSSSWSPSTPNIDRVGKEGMKLLNWNSAAALCSASRAALLTGKYPVRTGVYPRVFRPDATLGLLPEETTLAELLKAEGGYATNIVGKWHLGHRHDYLPTNQGFDSWLGIPYHMSGGSVDGHICNSDQHETMWLPLYEDDKIVEQPVQLENLAEKYATNAIRFIEDNTAKEVPFFLYLAFSHVHQLCAPRDFPEQGSCQWGSSQNATFSTAVQEMDWIAGQILDALDSTGATDNTVVLFTSDNGPWVAEQECAGSKGLFQGDWLRHNVDPSCTACPHDYVPHPTEDRPRRCVLPDTSFELDGVHCGEDTGLGSCWESNLRMPALVRFPGRIPPGVETKAMISTLDVVPTFLSIIDGQIPIDLDGIDVKDVLFGNRKGTGEDDERILFFWRDGFSEGPLPQPYGRFDVAAVRMGDIKAWFWTKSAHYNSDKEAYHDPPLLFDVMNDPAESEPLDPTQYETTIRHIKEATARHKKSMHWMEPLTLSTNPKYIPCFDHTRGCRTNADFEEDVA